MAITKLDDGRYMLDVYPSGRVGFLWKRCKRRSNDRIMNARLVVYGNGFTDREPLCKNDPKWSGNNYSQTTNKVA